MIRRYLMPVLVLLIVFSWKVEVGAATRPADVTSPSQGCVLAEVPGNYEESNISAIIRRVNELRYEACKEGVPSPDDPAVKLTLSDYVPIKWSGDLELIAQLRSAEACVYEAHTRPNGSSCFSVKYNGVGSSAENLAWNYSGISQAISQWYDEKADWVSQKGYAVTGHYTSLINPDFTYVGMGCFEASGGNWMCTAAEFSGRDKLSETGKGYYGRCDQTIEVKKTSVGSPVIDGADKASVTDRPVFTLSQSVSYPGIMGGTNKTGIKPLGFMSWGVSDPAVAGIDTGGKLTPLKEGNISIFAVFADGSRIERQLRLTYPSKGKIFELGGYKYIVTVSGSEVGLKGIVNNRTNVVIPDTLTYYGRRYKISSIASSAFSGNKVIKSLKIGRNVSKIGKKAFYKCKGLKKININTKRLKASKVGKNAFKGIYSKAVVKVPSKMKNSYKKWLGKKGLPKKAKIK